MFSQKKTVVGSRNHDFKKKYFLLLSDVFSASSNNSHAPWLCANPPKGQREARELAARRDTTEKRVLRKT